MLLILAGIIAGCTALLQPPGGQTTDPGLAPDRTLLDNALVVYQGGDYEQARDLFKTITVSDADKGIRETAHLGETCCRLMMASSQEEYKAAIGMWKIFRISASSNDLQDALTLLDPLIVRLSSADDARSSEAPTTSLEGAPPAPQTNGQPLPTDDRRLQSEIRALRKKAALAEQLQNELEAVTAENQSLKEKIKALEAIDQTIQKKKTEISAPSE